MKLTITDCNQQLIVLVKFARLNKHHNESNDCSNFDFNWYNRI